MSAYFVVRAHVDDWDAYQPYAQASPGVLARYGGRHIARGGRTITFEGEPIEPGRLVIAEFRDFETAEACYRSPEYQELVALRADAARFDFYLIEGLAEEGATGAPHDR